VVNLGDLLKNIEMRDVIGDLLQVLHFLFKGRYQDMGECMRFGGDALSFECVAQSHLLWP
jgi:hypothetical protein